MAEKNLWKTGKSCKEPTLLQPQETIQEISKAWKAISNAKAALRHIENKLDVAPTSSVIFDPIMEARKPVGATRKISRKDGRYLEDTNSHPKSSRPRKSVREKTSRSPLRVTTLESNVKSSCHVGFREPLASYRDAASMLSSNEKSSVHPVSGLNNGGQDEKDFESTRTSAVDETSVRYLNDRLAIDALEWRLQQSHSDLQTGYREMKASDSSQQHVSFSPSSNKLETLKKRQPDTKLEKLKERIRRQWEMSVEKDSRERLQNTTNHTDTGTGTKTRKVAAAPPPPSYRGFNPPETKIRTPDGKVWQEAEFQNLSAQLHSTLAPVAPSFQEIMPTSEKTKEKRTSRPVRKVQRLGGVGGSASPEGKMGHIIRTSSWRDGQKLVKQILGPSRKVEKEAKSQSDDLLTNKQASSTIRAVDKRSTSKERSTERRMVSDVQERKGRSKSSDRHTGKRSSSKEPPKESQDKTSKSAHSSSRSDSHHAENSTKGQTNTNGVNHSKKAQTTEIKKVKAESTEVKKDFLPLEIRGILEDLQLDSAVDGTKQVRNRSHSPTKRKPDKGQVPEEPHVSSKRRHYDTEQVRLYIMRQQEERKKRQQEEREAQRQAEEQKNKRLQELYQKQKEAFSKAKCVSVGQREKEAQETASSKSLEPNLQRPHDTYTKLLLGQAWPEVSTQTKPLYQPSGESDKENKGQERPHSASSSSDLSLSEPLQPLLRNDLVEAYYPQPDRLTSKSLLPHSYSQTLGGAGILPQYLALPKDLDSLFSNWKSSTNIVPSSQKANVQGKPSTNFKSNLDRIESLKATAVSLSSRIENEAKKLAGGSINFPSAWSLDPEPRPSIKAAWNKPDSPPERESREDVFSSRMQKMLSTCSSNFSQDDLPGANHLYRKHPEELIPRTSTSLGTRNVGQEEKLAMQNPDTSARPPEVSKKASLSPNSSTSSISEGPILSEASFSEGEGLPKHESRPNPAETLKNKEFCVRDTKSFAPLSEFKREADKYLPLPTSSIRPDPWEELAKGSPHSVINIFTRSYQQFGKELNGHTEDGKQEPVHSAASPQNSISYADDFVSSQASEVAVDSQKSAHRSVDTSASSAKEELSAVMSRSEGASSHSSQPSSIASSPLSVSSHKGSSKRKGSQNGSPQQPVEIVQNVSSSEHKSNVSKQAQSVKEQSAGSESDSTMGDLSSRSITSLMSDGGRNDKTHHSSIKDTAGQAPSPPAHPVTAAAGIQAPGLMAVSGQSAIRFSPAGLQHRMSAELNYLGAMEESVRQLCDVERVRGISIAQQETVSLAQILKSQQQRHEQSMAALRLQAEQEAQASMRQLEEARQIASQTQAEMLQRFQKTLEASASQNVVQEQEAVDHDYLSPTSSDPAAISSMEQQKRQRSRGIRKRSSRSASPSSQPPSSVSSFKERSHSSSSEQESAPPSSVKEEIISQRDLEESISEELPTPEGSALKGDSSISLDDKDVSSAVPTNEEGIEELSFRSLLPSESHRRGSLERQRSRRHESDEESTPDKELSGPFSSGQDSFWKFTMEMVRQYMQEGEMRSAHQAALLRLRQKALKEKTKAELAWLEHQRRSLRDKGEDDKMPPLKKRQRGLLLRLQQEQAEIKRLQEANKAARRERQLILKQQEEIQRIQNSTLRLQEKLKSAESGQLEQPSEGDVRLSPSSSRVPSDAESRSPSPVSVSGSETSSIMQKLRKMHSHMDAKFLTKREQQLVQRRLHAQELLEWKRRLDAEELEIRRIEKQALAAWEKPRVKTKSQSTEGEDTVQEEKRSREASPTPMSPTIHTRTSLSPPPEYLSSESLEPSTIAEQIHEQSGEHSSISEDLALSALSKKSPPRSYKSQTEVESSKESTKSGRQRVHITLRPHQLSQTWSEESLSMTHSEATSDQSDIEGRIRALKEELRKRKSVVENLKKEQKRRQKERLRAQEAILLQQLQTYDEYIQKTQAELNREQTTPPPPSIKSVTKADKDLFSRTDSTSSVKPESEQITDISTRSEAESVKQEKLLATKNEVRTERLPDEPVLVLEPSAVEENVSVASSQSVPVREALPSSAHDSPVSSIHSEIPEDVLDTQSHRSISPSPTPSLNLNLRSETPEGYISPQKDHSYSDDFESSVPLKLSVSETPREEFDVSLTTPGRELHSDSFFEKEEDKADLKPASPHILDLSEVKPPSPEHFPSSDAIDPLAMFQLGDRVLVSGVQPGILRFKGETLFAEGIWAGIELDKSEGNNDGSLEGSRYFVCSPLHGIFAPPHKISRLVEEEFVPPSEEKIILPEDTAFVNRDYVDGHLPLIKDFDQISPEKTPLQSAESSVSELHTPSIQQELHVDIATDTALLDEEPKETADSLELIEEPHEDNFNKRAPEVGLISDSLLQACLKDTVAYLQNLRKQREQKIQQSNQEFHTVQASEEIPKQDQHQRLGPFQNTFTEQKVTEFDPSHGILSVLREDADWFEEDFGLSSHKKQHLERAPSAGTVTEPSMLAPRSEAPPKPTQPVSPPELIMAVPHSVLEVEQLVQSAVDELWGWKQLSLDIGEIRNSFTRCENEEQSPAYSAYKEMLFDLTLDIFEEICSPDPRGSQPPWKKPVRVTPSYSRRVRDPNNILEVKSFLTSEVLNLLNLKRAQNHKMDWQRMMKFGRKKRDRVDHILVQELHEEEAQWVNYDEDELFVKMQLADGIFEALIRDTIQVLQRIQGKKNHSPTV